MPWRTIRLASVTDYRKKVQCGEPNERIYRENAGCAVRRILIAYACLIMLNELHICM